jgi:hypothetical protein
MGKITILNGKVSSSTDFDLTVGATDVMTLEDGGNVGIGTTNPTSQLHTYGTSNFHTHERSGKIIYVNPNYSATDLYGQVAMRGADSMGLSLSSDEADAKQLFIEVGGNVGIGTSNPSAKLSVSNSGSEGYEIHPALLGTNSNRITNFNRSTSTYVSSSILAAVHN